MPLYVDASFVAKLLVEEAESPEAVRTVEQALTRGRPLVSSRIVVAELHRLAFRLGLPRLDVNTVLDVLTLVNPDTETFLNAGLIPFHVKTLDAIHIITALKVQADRFLTYDPQQQLTAEQMGLRTSPSPSD